MKTHNRIAWIPFVVLLGSAAHAEGSVDRVAEGAFADMARQMEARLADLDSELQVELDARLEEVAAQRVASRMPHSWMQPPVAVHRVRPLPARRATVLADSESAPGVTAPVARAAARARVDQEPFGG